MTSISTIPTTANATTSDTTPFYFEKCNSNTFKTKNGKNNLKTRLKKILSASNDSNKFVENVNSQKEELEKQYLVEEKLYSFTFDIDVKEDGVHIVFRKITNEVEFLKLQMKQKMNEMKARRNGSTMARRKEVKKQNNWITKDSRITKLMVEEYEYVCGVMDKINPEVKVPTPPELLVDVEAIKLQMKQIIIQAIVTSEDKKTVVSSLMRDPYLNYLQNVTGIQLSEVVKETVEV